MSSGFVSAWQGNRYGDVNGQTGYDLLTRAFPFECDPVDPNVSSPWHNAIYELTIDKYQWGFRSFQYNFLFGSSDSTAQVSFATWNTSIIKCTGLYLFSLFIKKVFLPRSGNNINK